MSSQPRATSQIPLCVSSGAGAPPDTKARTNREQTAGTERGERPRLFQEAMCNKDAITHPPNASEEQEVTHRLLFSLLADALSNEIYRESTGH